ncbi:uncharacterized protein Tsp26a isoform X1 [Temnothorax nylanderi]|uniref:uncharacterized protein Tsp26a isoform X1 n=1 Tax=Temnothorax nylanderi TaxID=102681 RepID=UPI003A8C612E
MSKASRSTKNASDFTVAELKDILKALGQSTGGTKAELIGKLMALDPEDAWMEELLLWRHVFTEDENDGGRTSDLRGPPPSPDDGNGSDERTRHHSTPAESSASADGTMQREMELIRKEKELMQRELDLARCEIEFLRRYTENALTPVQRREVSPSPSRVNVSIIAELLSYFDGGADRYDQWSKQVALLKTMYGLDDNTTRVLIVSRLRGKALDWFHSKSEHIELPINRLLEELKKAMFSNRRSKIAVWKQFEGRTWRWGEAFSEYLHDKVILANHVPVPDDEIIDYVIDGIWDPELRYYQARIQRFASTTPLLDAFETITIQPRGQPDGASGGRFDDRSSRFQKIDGREAQSGDRCYNCGQWGHVGAKCPSKSRGIRCFREFGHLAAKCIKSQPVTRESNAAEGVDGVGQSAQQRCCKDVSLFGYGVVALIDSGSDLTLLREQSYVKIGAPPLHRREGDETRLRGVCSGTGGTLGMFYGEVEIDDHSYPMTMHVVADSVIPFNLLIGNDFLKTVETNIKKGKITISKLEDNIREEWG